MSKKAALLEAAGLIVTEQGVQDLTLDAVAKRADVSKGGLLYHFPTKEAFIYALLEHFIRQFEDMVEAEINAEQAMAGDWLRAYVTVCTTIYEEQIDLSHVFLALSASNPQFAEPMQKAYERWHQRAAKDGVALDTSRLVCMAADGCWLYSLNKPGGSERTQDYLFAVRKQLHSLIDGSVEVSAQ